MPNLFVNSTKTVPTEDNMIIRVDMEQLDIGGRKSHLPTQQKSPEMSVQHVGSSASK